MSKYRIVYEVAEHISARTPNSAREALAARSDDLDEFAHEACSNVLVAKLQERRNIALPHENNGKPLWTWVTIQEIA